MRLFIIGISLIMGAIAPLLKGADRSTNAAPPKTKYDDFDRMYLSTEVPNPIDSFKYKVVGSFGGTEFYKDSVPIFRFDPRRSPAGNIPVGTEVTLDRIVARGSVHYYGMVKKKKLGKSEVDEIVWIDGRFIQAVKK